MTKDIAKWHSGGIVVHTLKEKSKVSADDVAHELVQVEKKYGSITPENVLEYARDENTTLHKLINWDDTQAAHEYRLLQVRYIIHNVHVQVVSDGEEKEIAVAEVVQQRDDDVHEKRSVALISVQNMKSAVLDKLQNLAAELSVSSEFQNVFLCVKEAIRLMHTVGVIGNMVVAANENTGNTRAKLNSIIQQRKAYLINGKMMRPKDWRMDGITIVVSCDIIGGGSRDVRMEMDEVHQIFFT